MTARLAVLLLLLTLATACAAPGAGRTEPGAAPGTPGDPGRADVALAPGPFQPPASTPEDGAAAAAAVNAFGLDLYRRLVEDDPDGGLVLSPASIQVALAMARAGARGKTAAEMDRVMRELGSDARSGWVAALADVLASRNLSGQVNGEPREVTLRAANAPFGQVGFALEPAYLEALASRFGAGLRLVDYMSRTEEARGTTNRWVGDQTDGRIPELLEPGVLTTDTRLALVNAMLLRADWSTPFSEAAPAPFSRPDGTAVTVPMMSGTREGRHARSDGWWAAEVPYHGGQLAMLVIVPEDLRAFESGLDAAALAVITGSLEDASMTLTMPPFGLETRADLGGALAALGMPTAFTDRADFGAITTAEPLHISRVVHQANIDVDTGGTTAAAATAVILERVSARIDDLRLRVDRPFLFALRDVETGTILFLGRVLEPSVRS